MVNLRNPFKGQQVLTLIGSEQTTSLLVVMIFSIGPVGGDDNGTITGGENGIAFAERDQTGFVLFR